MKHPLALLPALLALLIAPGWAAPDSAFEGNWSAPSLSQPNIPLLFSLLPDGQATEQVGTYHGTGTWKIEDGVAKIAWSSQWTGELRPLPTGKFELLTWKKDSPRSGPPDDTQPARRIEASAK